MPREISQSKIRGEAKAVRGLAKKALEDFQGTKPGLKAAKERDQNRHNAVSEDYLARLLSADPPAIPPALPTVEEELMALKMPSDTDPDMEELNEDALHDSVRPLMHPDAAAYIRAFPEEAVSDFFKFLGTGNLLTVQINVDRPIKQTLAVLNRLLAVLNQRSVIVDREPGWNTSKAEEYLSALASGVGKSAKPSTKTMRRKKATEIIQGIAPEQTGCNECTNQSDCNYLKRHQIDGKLCPPLEKILKPKNKSVPAEFWGDMTKLQEMTVKSNAGKPHRRRSSK